MPPPPPPPQPSSPPPPPPPSDCSVPVGAAPPPGVQGDYMGSTAGDAVGETRRGSWLHFALGVVAGFMLGPLGFLFLLGACTTLFGDEAERAGNRRKFAWGCLLGILIIVVLYIILYLVWWRAATSVLTSQYCFYDARGKLVCV
jgi:hypothetical protein